MSWKQPIPTDINFDPNFDALDRAVFREILSLCQNTDYLARFEHAGRKYTVELKRGQCIFKVTQFAKDLKNDPKRVRKSIENLSKWYTEMESKATSYGLIITVKDYDQLTKMESEKENSGRIEGEKKENRRRANIEYKDIEDTKSDEDKENKLSTNVDNLQKKKISFASEINQKNEKEYEKELYAQFPLFQSKDFYEAFKAYEDHKRKKKAALTNYAKYVAFKKLMIYSDSNLAKAIEHVEAAIENDWKGIYKLREEQKEYKSGFRKGVEDRMKFDNSRRMMALSDDLKKGNITQEQYNEKISLITNQVTNLQ